MIIDEAVKRFGQEPLLIVSEDTGSDYPTLSYCIIDAADKSSGNFSERGDLDALIILLNEASSRIPKEGERQCNTCRHMKPDPSGKWAAIYTGPGIRINSPLFSCEAPAPSMCSPTRASITDPITCGTDCSTWQRKEDINVLELK